jgi:hypothetical protein
MSHSNTEMPSKITNCYWVYAPGSFDSDDETSNNQLVGKWMIFLNKSDKVNDDQTELDICWEKIRNLVANNQLYGAKCSTSLDNPNSWDPKNGVIIVYTKNYDDRADVKRSVELIRKNIDYKQYLYYKTDEATLSGQYRKSGNKRVSLYRHSVEGEFSESVGKNWIIIYNV